MHLTVLSALPCSKEFTLSKCSQFSMLHFCIFGREMVVMDLFKKYFTSFDCKNMLTLDSSGKCLTEDYRSFIFEACL